MGCLGKRKCLLVLLMWAAVGSLSGMKERNTEIQI